MNALSGPEAERPRSYVDHLVVTADEVHLHPPEPLVIARPVLETFQLEIRTEFPVDAGEQIEIEGCRHTLAVIIGRLQNLPVLLEIDTDQQTTAGAGQPGKPGQHPDCLPGFIVADAGAREENDPWPFQRPGQRHIGGKVRATGTHLEPGAFGREGGGRRAQMIAGDIDRDIAPRLEAVEQASHLDAAATARLQQPAPAAAGGSDLLATAVENRHLGPGRIVLRQFADGIEQSRAGGVVEELRRNGPGACGEPFEYRPPQVRGRRTRIVEAEVAEIVGAAAGGFSGGHDRSLARRIPLNCQRSRG